MFEKIVKAVVVNVLVSVISYKIVNKICEYDDKDVCRTKTNKQTRSKTVIYTEFVEPTKES